MMKLFSCNNEIFPLIIPAILASLNAISDGMFYGWTSPEVPKIRATPNSTIIITHSDEVAFETIYMLAGLLGLPITILLVDRIGRKRLLLLNCLLTLTAWILIAFANRIQLLYASRAIAGIAADVAFVVSPMYISEISHKKHRGLLVAITFLFLLLGVLIIYAVAPSTPLYGPAILGAAIVLFQLSTFSFMPESPYFLLLSGDEAAATDALRRLRPAGDHSSELARISAAIAAEKELEKDWKDLLVVVSNRKAVFIAFWLNLMQHCAGITVMFMNFHTILAQANAHFLSVNSTGILFASLTMLAIMVGMLLVDRCGRKKLLMASAALSAVCLLALAVFFHLMERGVDVERVEWVPFAAVMGYAVALKLGLGWLPQTLAAELFPNNVKAAGMALSDAFYIGAASISIVFYQMVSVDYGVYVAFYGFGGVAVAAVAFTFVFVPETKGRTLEEVQGVLKGPWLNCSFS